MAEPSIYDFMDFRAFLAAWHASQQNNDAEFTKTAVSHRLGLPRTRGYFGDVLSGKKVTDTFLERFCVLLDLRRDEDRYFRCLVRFNQAETPEEKELALDLLTSLRKTPVAALAKDAWDYYRHWRHGAIRALLSLGEFDEKAICRAAAKLHASLTPGQVRDSLELLERLDLVTRSKDGRYAPTTHTLASPEYARDEVFRLLQVQQLDLVRAALLVPGDGNRAIATNLVSMSESAWTRLRERLDQFRSEVRSIVHSDTEPADRVALIAHILLPLHEAQP
jgi:uncharacterized protein (TIGR02147 family)